MYTHAVLVPFKVNPKDEGHADVLSIAKGLHERIRKHPYKIQNKTRRLYKQILRLGEDREDLMLSKVPFDSTRSTLYVTAHGNADEIGTRGPVSISPERLARKLAEAGMPKTLTDLKVMTCNSGFGWKKYGYLGPANTENLLDEEPQGTTVTTVDEEPQQEGSAPFTIPTGESSASFIPEQKQETEDLPATEEQEQDTEVVPDEVKEDKMMHPAKPKKLTFYVRRLCIALYKRGYTNLRVHGYVGFTGEVKKKGENHTFVTETYGGSRLIRASLSRVTVQGEFGWTVQKPKLRLKVK
ncbi:hypothetical protein COCOR_01529 [Corallococcus coralloides DSM 2259]|uniref:Uncharacterized protein n=1 Tax=Corallococcus coralloides (strain ATCC 25202 / DSM 2259 / NBRC 100086 / M2) TaxID=1144275 RepID=H8MWV2_CORCM|nr:hypothetical protein [Corallococcus coralloides]AFE04130.1 hypothetical protein COCOR_01529 [Corallococcus coralloides DSM 2259]